MTGFEYTAAAGMLYEGMTEAGVQCVREICERYDGRKRNPFDEAECGRHYARAMASWAAVLALSGFSYSAGTGTLNFTSTAGKYFRSNGCAWGSCAIDPAFDQATVHLAVRGGTLRFSRLFLRSFGELQFEEGRQPRAGGGSTLLCAQNLNPVVE